MLAKQVTEIAKQELAISEVSSSAG